MAEIETDFDAKPLHIPPHLVIMVNGIIGRYWWQ
jgi:hypothetical protein